MNGFLLNRLYIFGEIFNNWIWFVFIYCVYLMGNIVKQKKKLRIVVYNRDEKIDQMNK